MEILRMPQPFSVMYSPGLNASAPAYTHAGSARKATSTAAIRPPTLSCMDVPSGRASYAIEPSTESEGNLKHQPFRDSDNSPLFDPGENLRFPLWVQEHSGCNCR